jgi:hypothetical protein
MWLFTQHGFYSIVQATDKEGRAMPEFVAIRGRVRSHLANLTTTFAMNQKIIHTPDADYAYRLIAPRSQFEALCYVLAREVDYPNFKGRCHKKYGNNSKYTQLLSRIWHTTKTCYERMR